MQGCKVYLVQSVLLQQLFQPWLHYEILAHFYHEQPNQTEHGSS